MELRIGQKLLLQTDTKLIKLVQDEIAELNQTPIVKGTTVEKGSSMFTGYVCDTQNFNEVNQAFEYVRFHNLHTRHIICACIIPGVYVTDRYDYYDDNEHAAGIQLLNYMIEAKLENRAIYVVRQYDGTHIGPDRFDCIISAAKKAVNFKPYNAVLGSFQFSWPKLKPSRGRGGMAGGRPLRQESELSSRSSNYSDSGESEVLLNNYNPNAVKDWAFMDENPQSAFESQFPSAESNPVETW